MGDTSFLNLTLLSAQGLKDVCTFGTMSPYAKAWIDPSMKQRTPVAPNAGCTPVWGHKLCLPLPSNALEDTNIRLSIQVMNQGTATDTVVGTATIPLGDLIQSTSPNGLEFMAVQLQRPSGRVQGLVNFSVEIADRSQKYWRPSSSSSSSSKSKGPGYTVDQSIRQNVNLRADSVVKVGSSLDSLALNDPRGRLFGGKEPLAAPDALGSGHIADCRPEPIRQQHRSMETFLGHDKCAVDLLGPSQRSNSIGSLVLRSLVMPPVAASTGTAGNVAPDALDRCKPKPVFQQQDKNAKSWNRNKDVCLSGSGLRRQGSRASG
ncbi:hypothetical protein MPTK1_Vg00400 [Marchantia polymorpha subsp. ruderalis]|uniref:C2 domain-containing protein n=1 Tax=Marchantia polymorpha TaxID=3197 RepID=A0A2R6VWQ4_MARPO|nr:hypothetical protein MARPO_YB0012 [Marchantia polymorpha]BBN20523.1 hypothetical protein Mp_Vg00400 [Marchantia polymorpha subsp. ruderalis]|eukprot:PTQ26039.1 hypothetical protein MARPO_YB0012 [Marchantia polymorpha]